MKYPTDLEILKFIHDEYFDEFCRYDLHENIRSSKIYISIDCRKVAENFDTNGDIIFGRLYYDIGNRYSYETSDKSKVSLFALKVGGDMHCIHFPYLSSVVSDLRHQNNKTRFTLIASFAAVTISLASLIVAVLDKL